MIKFDTLPHNENIYTWVDEKNGNNINIASERLRQWVIKQSLEIQLAPVDRDLAKDFVRTNTIDPKRVMQLAREVSARKRTLDPVILCKRGTYTNGGPDVMLVDGHHRYVIYAAAKHMYIPCYMLEVNQWRPFQIVGCPALTPQQLENIPLKERNY